LNGPKPDPLHLKGGGLQRSLGKKLILTLPVHCAVKACPRRCFTQVPTSYLAAHF
jgi:hypothetical protein